MGIKDKLKGAWKRVSELEDDSEYVRSQSKGSERVPFKDISKKLKEVMKQNVDVVGRKIIIPNYYAIYFSEIDRNMRAEVEEILCDELKEELFHEMRKINPEQNKLDILIEIKSDTSLEKGQFRVVHHVKKSTQEVGASNKVDAEGKATKDLNKEKDYLETIVEQTPKITNYDEEMTIVQPRESTPLYKVLVESRDRKEEIVITKEVISIGRSNKDDVFLSSPDFSISRSHATLELREGSFYLLPSGINGTFLNGQELELKKEVQVSPDDEIRIMNYTLKILK